METVNVFLLDDHKLIRDGIRSILAAHPKYHISGESGDPSGFLSKMSSLLVDVLILDVSFPDFSGFDVLKKIRSVSKDVKIMVLSMHNDPEYVQKAMLLGANGYLVKDCDASQLVSSLEGILDGKLVCSPTIMPPEKKKTENDVLTQRELEILKLISGGLSSKQIAGELAISTRTVETHRLHIMKKLGTNNSAETISVAVRRNLL